MIRFTHKTCFIRICVQYVVRQKRTKMFHSWPMGIWRTCFLFYEGIWRLLHFFIWFLYKDLGLRLGIGTDHWPFYFLILWTGGAWRQNLSFVCCMSENLFRCWIDKMCLRWEYGVDEKLQQCYLSEPSAQRAVNYIPVALSITDQFSQIYWW